ncbi:glutathione S-transferase family protein [Nordella sp. HKS 07]|uniref:glutathione S-transferase family protein n=1 Tax=Nordella sp. HKS 07 TaxID=2712222 RepID=UPI0013E1BF01|nr:glutathione S-transferase family protein [Nordella sp. HKS 07]QIG51407.1 glutathione S-transferase family protein [Nordella sp. HKS 07]
MKLHGDLISPFFRMCLVTAHEVGLAAKIQHVQTRADPTAVNPDLNAISPVGKVPVLVTDHNHPLYDSRVIVEYLCHVSGNKTLIPDDGVKRFRVLTLQALGQAVAEAGVAFRYETAVRPQGLQWREWIARQELRVKAEFDDLEKTWIKDLSEITAGSIAVAVALSYLDFRIPDWQWRKDRPNLQAFHDEISRRPSMQVTVLKPA